MPGDRDLPPTTTSSDNLHSIYYPFPASFALYSSPPHPETQPLAGGITAEEFTFTTGTVSSGSHSVASNSRAPQPTLLSAAPGVGWNDPFVGALGNEQQGGDGQAKPPTCRKCKESGLSCYYIEGFDGCIPCMAAGQPCEACTPPSAISTNSGSNASAPAQLQGQAERPKLSVDIIPQTTQSSLVFGIGNSPIRQTPNRSRNPTSFADLQSSSSSSKQKLSGPDVKLGYQEQARALASVLIEESYTMFPHTWHASGFILGDMRMLFEEAGRDMKALGPVGEAVAAIHIAWGSRVSSHSAILSSSALPAPPKLKGDLRSYGIQRETACRLLQDQACKLVDASGCVERESYTGMSVLLELASLLMTYGDFERGFHYINHAVSHYTHLAAKAKQRMSASGMPGYVPGCQVDVASGTVVMDSVLALRSGRLPNVSEDELQTIRDLTDLSFDIFLRPDYLQWADLADQADKLQKVWEACVISAYRMSAIATLACTPDNERLHAQILGKVLESTLVQRAWMRELRKVVAGVAPTAMRGGTDPPNDLMMAYPDDFLYTECIFRIHHLATDRRTSPSVEALHRQTTTLVALQISKIGQYAKQTLEDPPMSNSIWAILRNSLLKMISHLPGRYEYLLQYITQENGRAVAEKRADVQAILDLMKCVSWLTTEFAQPVTSIEARLVQMEGKRRVSF